MAEVVGFSDNFPGLNGRSEIVVKITSVKFDQNLDLKYDETDISKDDLVVLKRKDCTEQQLWRAKIWCENKGVYWTFKNVANGGFMHPDMFLDPTNPKSLKVRTNPNIQFKWKVQPVLIRPFPPIHALPPIPPIPRILHYTISPSELSEPLKGNIELLNGTFLKAVRRDLPVEVSPIPIGPLVGVPLEFQWDITIV